MTDIGGVNHAGIHVRDLERSLAFYRDLLGLEVVRQRDAHNDYAANVVGYPGAHMKIAMLRHPSGGAMVELIEYVEPAGTPIDTATPNPGTAHICFTVTDIHATYARLSAAGVPFRHPEPVAIQIGPLAGGYAVYFTDPDGIALELLQPPT